MQIDIHIPRPGLLMLAIAGVATFCVWQSGAAGIGGSGDVHAHVVQDAEEDVRKLRLEQQVQRKREEILRNEVALLEDEIAISNDPATLDRLQETRRHLISLINDQRRAEEEIRTALNEIWEAQGFAVALSQEASGGEEPEFAWPVEPELGISAYFADKGYEKRFGMSHRAIDIPADQGTIVAAAADGTVAKISDNGMGFNSIILRHAGGYATLYGHVSEFLVSEGETVRRGDPIARSGGMPGTKGAGHMTTGAHLHLEFFKDGAHVDPMPLLPDSALYAD